MNRGDDRGSLEAEEGERRIRGCWCTAWAGQEGRTVIETRRDTRGPCTSERDKNGNAEDYDE